MAFYEFRDISIAGIAVAVPENLASLETFIPALGRETVEKFRVRTGIDYLRIALETQTSSDLGYVAADELLRVNRIDKSDIGFVVYISRTPDYRSPATATVLHYRLALSQDCIAYDLNLGGAGFFYGLQVGCSLLENINKELGLVILGNTSSKEVSPSDPARLMLGDCGSALILKKTRNCGHLHIQTGSESSRFRSVYIPGGGFRPLDNERELLIQNGGFPVSSENLFIDWSELLSFAGGEMDHNINVFIKRINRSLKDFNICVYAGLDNQMEGSSHKTKKPEQGLKPFITSDFIYYDGSTVPFCLVNNFAGKSDTALHVLGVGYGEGLSWGLTDFFINTMDLLPLIKTDEVFGEGNVSHDF